jgi:hypothetical protein
MSRIYRKLSLGATGDDIKKHITLFAITALLTAIVTGFGFYYKTNSAIEHSVSEIYRINQSVKSHSDKISEMSLQPVRLEEQVKSVQLSINDIKIQQQSLAERQDRMMELLVDISRATTRRGGTAYIPENDTTNVFYFATSSNK